MMRLALYLHLIIGASMAGTFIIVVLVLNAATLATMIIAGVAGYVVAAPVSWLIAKALMSK